MYLFNNGFVDSVYGSSELFLFNIEKVIININLGPINNMFALAKSRLRSDVQLPPEQFHDAILLSGCSFCRTFPPLENSTSRFSDAVALLKRHRSVGNAINAHPDQGAYLEKFKKARAAIRHHIVLTEEGKTEPLEFAESPGDVHEFIGQRLPEELYFYLSRGMIGPQVLDMITTREYIQAAPLDNNDSEEYKKFLTGLNVTKTEGLSLLAKSMHRYWLTREVKVYYWFDPTHPKTLIHKDITYQFEAALKWNVREDVWGPVMDKQKVVHPPAGMRVGG